MYCPVDGSHRQLETTVEYPYVAVEANRLLQQTAIAMANRTGFKPIEERPLSLDHATAMGVSQFLCQQPVQRLDGPDALSTVDIAALATRISGKPIGVTTAPPTAQGTGFEAKVVEQFLKIVRNGGAAQLADTVATVLGRPPRSVEAFLKERLATTTRRQSNTPVR